MDIDIERIRGLVELMVANDLSRIELREGEAHLLLRRGQPVMAGAPGYAFAGGPTAASAATAPASPAPHGGPGLSNGEAAPAAAPAAGTLVIRSPVVGTFYSAADPESPPFVKVGDVVGPDSVVCLVEAMKVFNEIKAEVSGRIAKVLVKSGQAVEYDQPLFELVAA